MNLEVREAVIRRALWKCECGCGRAIPPGEVDHFFGRAKADETVATCWVLTPRCHFEKTNNHPTAGEWLNRFVRHADRHGYTDARNRAQLALLWKEARGSFQFTPGRKRQ